MFDKFQFVEQLNRATDAVILREAAEQAAKPKNLRANIAAKDILLPGFFDSLNRRE